MAQAQNNSTSNRSNKAVPASSFGKLAKHRASAPELVMRPSQQRASAFAPAPGQIQQAPGQMQPLPPQQQQVRPMHPGPVGPTSSGGNWQRPMGHKSTNDLCAETDITSMNSTQSTTSRKGRGLKSKDLRNRISTFFNKKKDKSKNKKKGGARAGSDPNVVYQGHQGPPSIPSQPTATPGSSFPTSYGQNGKQLSSNLNQSNLIAPGGPKRIRDPVSFKNIPIEHQLYYHGSLPRDEILALIKQDGDFIIRESSKSEASKAVLSVFWQRPYHFPVKINNNGMFYLEGPRFPTIPQMIDYYVMTGEFVTQLSKAQLITPIKREKWELHSEDIDMLERLGSGNFGDVHKGVLRDPEHPGQEIYVAIKTCKLSVNPNEQKKFMSEARIMRRYLHPHIVRLIGVCAERDKMWIVMELVTGGSLIDYLTKNKGLGSPGEKATFCVHAASGMAYLEEQKCIHRDLAARNCLLTNTKLLKISDFGMSREGSKYAIDSGMQVPVKWTAPEALLHKTFTGKSDVWSFGILMWEIYSEGQIPYPGMQNRDIVVALKYNRPFLMTPPDGMPMEFNDIMQMCWNMVPEGRPSFSKLRGDLGTLKQTLYPPAQ